MIDFSHEISEMLHSTNNNDSHREMDYKTFHPSQLANCKRQCLLSKLGIVRHDTETLGTFRIGSLIHSHLENNMPEFLDNVEFEKELEVTLYSENHENEIPIVLTGHCDCFDYKNNVVYDFKTRSGWYKFNPPSQRHIKQITTYMRMIKESGTYENLSGQVVYVSKKNMSVKCWPEDASFEYEHSVCNNLLQKARKVQSALLQEGFPTCESEIPFAKCGCWICNNEGKLDFSHIED